MGVNDNVKENFSTIIKTLLDKGHLPTPLAHAIGYTTTTQMYNVMEGKSSLSTKAVINLIENLEVNPSYLFLNQGNMFLSEESEIELLKKENEGLKNELNEATKSLKIASREFGRLKETNETLLGLSKMAMRVSGLSIREIPDEDKDVNLEDKDFLDFISRLRNSD